MAIAVSAMTGMAAVAGSCLSRAVAARPSMPGNWISIRIRWGRSVRASVSPLSASTAQSTVWPALRTSREANFMLARLSSMIRMVATVRSLLMRPQRSPDLGDEEFMVEFGFRDNVDDIRRIAAEGGTVFRRDHLGGHHQN